MPLPPPNFREAREQCDFIAGKADPAMTFQVFDDKTERFDIAGKRSGKLSDKEIQRWLTAKAAQGCGVFVTVNETDLKGRKRENMRRYRVAVADFDGVELPQDWPDVPDMIVESSPKKYHAYWKLTPGEDFNEWSDMQARIAYHFGSDPRVHDAPRVFRLAGFWHQKAKPFRTRIISRTDPFDVTPRALADFAGRFPAEDYDPPAPRKDGGRSSEPMAGWDHEEDVNRVKSLLKQDKNRAKTGDRNNKAYRMAALLNDFAISPAKSLELLTEWNDAQDDPLPPGEIDHVIRSAPEYKAGSAGSKSVGDTPSAEDEFASLGLDPIWTTPEDETAITEKPKDAKKVSTEDWPPAEKIVPTRIGGMEWELASNITPDSVKWLWPNRIPRGKVSLIGGFPNQGKSQILCNLAAIITTGGQWPNGEGTCDAGAVMILAAEDTANDMLIPRLMAAGADLNQILIVNPLVKYKEDGKNKTRVMNIEDDLKRIHAAIEFEKTKNGRHVKAILIDPLNAYFGGSHNVDSHNASEMRALLTPLSKWCGDKDIAVIGISHFNKSNNSHILYRITDSAAITAVCRAVWFAVQDEEDSRYYLVEGKKNVGKKSKSIEYEITDCDIGRTDSESKPIVAPYINWLGKSDKQAHEVLGSSNSKRDVPALDKATKFLTAFLSKGPVSNPKIKLAASEADIADATLRRAKEVMKLMPRKMGMPGVTHYSLDWLFGDAQADDDFSTFNAEQYTDDNGDEEPDFG